MWAGEGVAAAVVAAAAAIGFVPVLDEKGEWSDGKIQIDPVGNSVLAKQNKTSVFTNSVHRHSHHVKSIVRSLFLTLLYASVTIFSLPLISLVVVVQRLWCCFTKRIHPPTCIDDLFSNDHIQYILGTHGE